MEKLTLKQFLSWRLLGIIGLYAIVHQFNEKIGHWYYSSVPVSYNLESISLLFLNFIDILIIVCFAFYIIRWLNSILSWSAKDLFFRLIVEIILFTLVSTTWLVFSNGIHTYLKVGYILRLRDVIMVGATGTIVNFIMVPIVELSFMLHSKHHAEISTKQLQISNEKFKYEILKNQINPHFLFNSLSVLNSLITIDAVRAKEFTYNFSNVLRHVLEFRDTDSITLEDEKIFLDQYIFLLKTRFGSAFKVDLDIPNALAQKQILPMVLQLLLENVIKHNEILEANPMIVQIKAQESGISISNPIQLKSSISSWGIGLENIRKRYASMGLSVSVQKDQGTFHIFIPYIQH